MPKNTFRYGKTDEEITDQTKNSKTDISAVEAANLFLIERISRGIINNNTGVMEKPAPNLNSCGSS